MNEQTTTNSDTEILEFLDFEETKACEGTEGCGFAAVALAVHTCCGLSYYLCEHHKRGTQEFIRRYYLHCNGCGADPAPAPRILPLGG